jgi:hypothetical protein
MGDHAGVVVSIEPRFVSHHVATAEHGLIVKLATVIVDLSSLRVTQHRICFPQELE